MITWNFSLFLAIERARPHLVWRLHLSNVRLHARLVVLPCRRERAVVGESNGVESKAVIDVSGRNRGIGHGSIDLPAGSAGLVGCWAGHESSGIECSCADISLECSVRDGCVGEGIEDGSRRVIGRMSLSVAKLTLRSDIELLASWHFDTQAIVWVSEDCLVSRWAFIGCDCAGGVGLAAKVKPQTSSIHLQEMDWGSAAERHDGVSRWGR